MCAGPNTKQHAMILITMITAADNDTPNCEFNKNIQFLKTEPAVAAVGTEARF